MAYAICEVPLLADLPLDPEIGDAMGRAAGETEVTSECVPNIGARGRRRRFLGGVLWSGITGAVLVLLAVRHAQPWTYLVVAPLTARAALGFFQAKEKT